MIVLDASSVVDFLLALPPWAARITARVQTEAPALAAPHLIDAEVGQVLRRFVRAGQLAALRAAQAIDDLLAMPLVRYPHTPLLPRAFALRDNATVYDALYIARAEALDAPLITRDGSLATIPGCRARVETLS
jgi:predicted nucleic acid-binding protein